MDWEETRLGRYEIYDGQSYSVEYGSNIFVIKIEKYRREFYVTLFKTSSKQEVNLFNLLSYLNKESKESPKSEYFNDEVNMEESYRKQLDHISATICNNFEIINFFYYWKV